MGGQGRGRGVRLGMERGGQVVVVAVVVGVETSPNGRLSYTSTKCWEAWTPTACAVPVKYVPLSNRFSFEAKLVEHSEVEQAACTT